MFRIGKCYYAIGITLGAQQELRNYLFMHPDGTYAEEARSIIQEIGQYARDAAQRSGDTRDRLREEVADLEKQLKGKRGNKATIHYALGAKYWELGEYTKSFRNDVEAYKLNPDYAFDAAFRTRVNFTDDGKPYSKTLAVEKASQEIIQVRNVNTNVARTFGQLVSDRVVREYVISGEVANLGTVLVKGIQLEVTVYRFGNKILSTKMVKVGDISPGQERAFTVSFSENQVDDVYVIYDYKIKPIYSAPAKPKK